MVLAAFGDSFIFGSELSDCDPNHLYDSHFTWPRLVSKELGVDYMCLASPGIGNQQIADDVANIIATQGNSVIYSIHWTWIDRFDYIGDFPGRSFGNDVWVTTCPGDSDKRSELYYKNLHSEMLDKIKSIGYVYQTICLLKEHDCKFHMTYMDNLLLDQIYHSTSGTKLLQDKIIKYLDNYNGLNFVEWSKKNNYPIGKHLHPLEQAHQKAFEYWLPKVRTLINSSAKEDYLHAFI